MELSVIMARGLAAGAKIAGHPRVLRGDRIVAAGGVSWVRAGFARVSGLKVLPGRLDCRLALVMVGAFWEGELNVWAEELQR